MRGLVLALALLATAVVAKPKLSEVFDPAEMPLSPYGWDEWRKLPDEAKLESRGIDPGTWQRGPDPKPATAPGNGRDPTDRYPGFRFAKRLERKRRQFDELVQGLPPSSIEGLIAKLTSIDNYGEDFEKQLAGETDELLKVKEPVDRFVRQAAERHKKKHGVAPKEILVPARLIVPFHRQNKRVQLLLSTQESERQFHAWLLPRFAEVVAALSEDDRARPYAALAKGMAHKDWRQRVRCGTIVAHLRGEKAASIFDAAMAAEKDPYVLAELVRLRARSRPQGLFEALSALLADENWQVRATVYDELSRLPRRESVDLLIARLEKEEGRLLDDIVDALEVLTGKRFDPDPAIWKGYWNKQRATWEPPKEGKKPGERIVKEGGEGKSVSFYGIRTHSKRIVFCLDVSGSMAEPLDGRGGKGAPRIDTAREQLEKALRSLPDDALFTIVTYSSEVKPWKRQLVKASDANKKKAWAWASKREADGSTNIYDALDLSLRIATGKRGASADTIFFMTDGMPTDGRVVDPAQILAEITARNRRVGVVIHAIGVSKEQNASFLLNLARANGGRYVAHK